MMCDVSFSSGLLSYKDSGGARLGLGLGPEEMKNFDGGVLIKKIIKFERKLF